MASPVEQAGSLSKVSPGSALNGTIISTPETKLPDPAPTAMTPKAVTSQLTGSFKEGSAEAVAASRAGEPHAVAYRDGSKRIANVAGSNDGHRWESLSSRKCMSKDSTTILSLHPTAIWGLEKHMIAYACIGEWECANPLCNLAGQTQEQSKFNMKR